MSKNSSMTSQPPQSSNHQPTTQQSRAQRVIGPTHQDSRLLFLKPYVIPPAAINHPLKRPALRVSGQITADILRAFIEVELGIDKEKGAKVVLFCEGVQVADHITLDLLWDQVYHDDKQWIELGYRVVEL